MNAELAVLREALDTVGYSPELVEEGCLQERRDRYAGTSGTFVGPA